MCTNYKTKQLDNGSSERTFGAFEGQAVLAQTFQDKFYVTNMFLLLFAVYNQVVQIYQTTNSKKASHGLLHFALEDGGPTGNTHWHPGPFKKAQVTGKGCLFYGVFVDG